MSFGHAVTVLFESEALRVSEFACACLVPHHAGEEAAPGHEIVLPQKGYFERKNALGNTQGDPTKALYFNRGQPFEISHPLGGGDVCTIFEVAPETLSDFCAHPKARERVLEGKPFAAAGRPIGHDLAYQHFRLLQKAKKGGPETLGFEEAGLSLLARVVGEGQEASNARNETRTKRARETQKHLAERTIRYLNRHFGEPLTLDRLAREVGSSPYHLCRIFKAETGMTIHGYLSALRLRAGLYALFENGQALTPLALDLGYSSHSHFSAAFQKAFGQPPRTVRNLLN